MNNTARHWTDERPDEIESQFDDEPVKADGDTGDGCSEVERLYAEYEALEYAHGT